MKHYFMKIHHSIKVHTKLFCASDTAFGDHLGTKK